MKVYILIEATVDGEYFPPMATIAVPSQHSKQRITASFALLDEADVDMLQAIKGQQAVMQPIAPIVLPMGVYDKWKQIP